MNTFANHSKWIVFLILAIFAISCTSKTPEPDTDFAYVNEIKAWHQKRLASLKSATGWLSLSGLFWLEEGENTFGSDSSNSIVFPQGKAPEFMGTFILKDGTVDLQAQPGAGIYCEGEPVEKMKVFGSETEKPPVLTHGSLSWFIIQRGTRIGVRLRDSENPLIEALKVIETYPIDKKWRVEAALERYDPPKQIPIQNVLGMAIDTPSPGMLVFQLAGQTYRLEAVDEGGDELFIMFTDETSGEETYGAGRYLYIPKPGENGKTVIDFNKAYNPPCAFTDYATCPLPPQQNHLSLKVTAGEKTSHLLGH